MLELRHAMGKIAFAHTNKNKRRHSSKRDESSFSPYHIQTIVIVSLFMYNN